MVKIIDLLCNEQAGNYRFEKKNDVYEVEDISHNLGACLDDCPNKEIEYYITGVYNSGCDWCEIDILALMELKKLCEALKNQLIEGDIK